MIIGQVLLWAGQKLKKTSSSPALDAEVLLAHVLRRDRSYLYANLQKKLTAPHAEQFARMVHKRVRHWPVAYLVGHKQFFDLDFKVTPDVLIPRPETELLVELALSHLSPPQAWGGLGRGRTVIDLGTGSGNVIISVIKNVPPLLTRGGLGRGLKFYALDSSAKALKIAKRNARRHRVFSKIRFLHGNLLSPMRRGTPSFFSPLIRGGLRGGRTIILANLPYLTRKQLNNLTIKHESRRALYGGPDGLKYFSELFTQLSVIARRETTKQSQRLPRSHSVARNDKKIVLLLEHDPRQKRALQSLTRKYFPRAQICFHKDLSGRFRVMEILSAN